MDRILDLLNLGHCRWVINKHLTDGIYTGQWMEDVGRHGWGIMGYDLGNALYHQYIGGWDGNRFHGYGELWYKSNSHGWEKYSGGWNEGKKHGYGILEFVGGDKVYDGGWNEDKRHGYGVYQYKSASGTAVTYKGCFELDHKWEGTLTGKDSHGVELEYFGRFHEDCFHDERALVFIGWQKHIRHYRRDEWEGHGRHNEHPRADVLDCLKGEQ